MPFVFVVVGIGLVVVAIRGTQATAFQLLQSEFSGPNSFIKWALAIFILGGLGYVPVIRPVTRAMLLLVLLVIFLKNGTGLFDKTKGFNAQIASPTAPPTPSTGAATASGATSTAPNVDPYLLLSPQGQTNVGNAQSTGNTWRTIFQNLFHGSASGTSLTQ